VVLKSRRHNHQPVGATVKKSGDATQNAMEQFPFAGRANGRQ
jgi:hypothetical protein